MGEREARGGKMRKIEEKSKEKRGKEMYKIRKDFQKQTHLFFCLPAFYFALMTWVWPRPNGCLLVCI
jgi:hypothetical protein